MLGKKIEITPMESLFLMVLHKSVSLSGSEIVQKLKEDLGDEWSPSPGATYKIVQSLEKKGFIQETTENEKRKDQRIRTYSLTTKGREIVPIITSRVRKVVIFISSCCPDCRDGLAIDDEKKSNLNS
ncbi:MAG: PadR family transcriptional regulator [Candidatus Hodarchaeales archaeon]